MYFILLIKTTNKCTLYYLSKQQINVILILQQINVLYITYQNNK